MKTLVFIVGPTAVGKTRLSIALAKKLRGEVVSCDSMQLYRGVPILTQAPDASDRRAVPHHLVGVYDPRKEYSVATYRTKAVRAIRSILTKKKTPLIVGGSGLYVKALIDGLFPAPPADAAFRARMERAARREGSAALHRRLVRIDPVSARRIHPNDTRRLVRALELFHVTGKTMTELAAATKGLKDDYRIVLIGLKRPRAQLYRMIDARVEKMLADGAVAETRRLLTKKLSRTAAAIIGVREIGGYLRGEYDLDIARDLLQKNTRRLAKRQLTWFRADKRIRWFDVSRGKTPELTQKIARHIRKAGEKR